ncbi:ABC transporter substrate-binding protein [Falsiroseomonas selenitidurans]|uniref:ABC transporter substrate-binding protein n=1 Tax=Falsiroseomonas selenitidurans TaxID=2716335 RepID=A0ABX1ECT3_9PROT|nr:ABC transporter substrate-binding protein [Falsiroseomonas selenitidurans]NKC33702.1 ABC transporter substrate-binding protein [Falsiroseomonas selenitidurans]
MSIQIGRRQALGLATGLAAGSLAIPGLARAQAAPVKIGLVAVQTGPAATLGTHLRDGFLLGMKHLDSKLGGRATEVLPIDDELRPDVAVTKVRAALERDKVDFVVGVVFSNILAAIMRPVTDTQTFLISTNAGPSPFAGRGCNPYFFATSYVNDQNHAVMGKAAQDAGYKRVMLLVPNYQAGRDSVAGFKSEFKGEVVEEMFTPLTQMDFSAELARIAAANPDALFTFMPGGLGVNLVRQYRQAGLQRIPFLSAFTVDESVLPAQGAAAVGFQTGTSWTPTLPGEQNARFVRDFEAQFNYVPASYAAHAYDAAMLLDSALRRTGGSLADKGALRTALKAADFRSVRGNFAFGANHFPVQDFWLAKVAQRPDGKFQTEHVRKVYENVTDPFAAQCRMPAG